VPSLLKLFQWMSLRLHNTLIHTGTIQCVRRWEIQLKRRWLVDLGRVHGHKTALSRRTAIELVGGPDDKLHDYIDGLLNVIRCKQMKPGTRGWIEGRGTFAQGCSMVAVVLACCMKLVEGRARGSMRRPRVSLRTVLVMGQSKTGMNWAWHVQK